MADQLLLGWPCHLVSRIAQALAAEEPILPPTDWIVGDFHSRQRMLFETRVEPPATVLRPL